ncbi:MAG: MbnP family protein [Flavobacteriales bacterium]|nr:hypothetical protein [Flavobacteriales bacterium]
MNSKNLLLLASMAIAITACKKDDDPAPTPAPAGNNTATVKMAFTFMNGTAPFDMNASYQDGAGHAFRFSGLKFYVSDIHLTDDGGATVGEFHDTYLLVDAGGTNDFTLGAISAAHIHEAHFALGLESAVNHADPLAAEYPLNVPDMHWSWNPTAGYKFLLIEGKVDGNSDGDYDDAEDLDVQYHCATDAMFRETHEHIHADADAGTTVTLQAKVDVGVIISGLDLLANPTAHGGGANNALAMDSLVTAIDEM